MKHVTYFATALLLSLLAVSCRESQERAGEAPLASYEEFLSRYRAASFRLVYLDQDTESGGRRTVIWEKEGERSRFDTISEREAISGVSDTERGDSALTCLWASDRERQLFDASCFKGVGNVKGLIDTLLSTEQSARFTESREIGGVTAYCYDVSNPLFEFGSVCLSQRGEPLEIVVGGEVAMTLRAENVESSPPLNDDWPAPLVPGASFDTETHVKQVSSDDLNLPEIPPFQGSK
jgi:hypothetical protein